MHFRKSGRQEQNAFAEDTELELVTHLRLTHAEETISFLTEQTKIKVRLAVPLTHPRGLVPLLPSTYHT